MLQAVIAALLFFADTTEPPKTPTHKEATFPDSVRIELLTMKSQISDMMQAKVTLKEQFEKLNADYDAKLKDLGEKYAKREKELTPAGFHMDRTMMVLVPDKTDTAAPAEKAK